MRARQSVPPWDIVFVLCVFFFFCYNIVPVCEAVTRDAGSVISTWLLVHDENNRRSGLCNVRKGLHGTLCFIYAFVLLRCWFSG